MARTPRYETPIPQILLVAFAGAIAVMVYQTYHRQAEPPPPPRLAAETSCAPSPHAPTVYDPAQDIILPACDTLENLIKQDRANIETGRSVRLESGYALSNLEEELRMCPKCAAAEAATAALNLAAGAGALTTRPNWKQDEVEAKLTKAEKEIAAARAACKYSAPSDP